MQINRGNIKWKDKEGITQSVSDLKSKVESLPTKEYVKNLLDEYITKALNTEV